MAPGVRDLPANIALRDQLWRDLVPFDRPPPAARPELADVDPAEAAARLRRARLVGAELADAIASGDRGTIQAADRQPPRSAPRGTGRLQTLTGSNHPVGLDLLISWGPFALPYVIREVQVTGENSNAAPSTGNVRVSLFLTGDDRTNQVADPDEPEIWPTEFPQAANDRVLVVPGPSANSIRYPTGVLVTETARFLTARLRVSIGGMNATVGVTIEEVAAAGDVVLAGDALDFADLARRYVGGSRPPNPRGPGRAAPLGFTLQVTRGPQILFSRTVPFSAAVAREAGYNPVTGGANPGVIVHTTDASWSNAFEAERARRSF